MGWNVSIANLRLINHLIPKYGGMNLVQKASS